MFLFLDETGSDKRNSMRRYGYSLRGRPMVCQNLLDRGKRIAFMSTHNVLDCKTVTGSVDGELFYNYVQTIFLHLLPFDATVQLWWTTALSIMWMKLSERLRKYVLCCCFCHPTHLTTIQLKRHSPKWNCFSNQWSRRPRCVNTQKVWYSLLHNSTWLPTLDRICFNVH